MSRPAYARSPCSLFKFFQGVKLPSREPLPAEDLANPSRENLILEHLRPLQGGQLRLAYHNSGLSPARKQAWLACSYPYLIQDSDGDGLADWTGVVDEQLSPLLIPWDGDIDGDGLANVSDPEPFTGTRALPEGEPPHALPTAPFTVPSHLRLAEAQDPWDSLALTPARHLASLQAALYEKYGLLALNHTDAHAPAVLEATLVLLDHALPAAFLPSLGNVKYLYAFKGHNDRDLIASYHRQMQAISIAGLTTYQQPLTPAARINLIAAISHEMGHGFLLQKLDPYRLLSLGHRYGGFPEPLSLPPTLSFYSPLFFTQHQLAATPPPVSTLSPPWQELNITSHYALSNLHEWFAEAFAAYCLRLLADKGLLGGAWQQALWIAAQEGSSLWTNYLNLSDGLRSHFDSLLGEASQTAPSVSP